MLIQPIEFTINPIASDEVFLYIHDKIIPNIRPWYLISNYGRLFSTYSNRFMSLTKNADGYYVCTLRLIDNKGVTVYIHRIEMLVFKYEPGCEYLDIDHINCDKTCNILTNLEWVTNEENTRRAVENGLFLTGEDAPWTKVDNNKAHEICRLYEEGYGISSIAKYVECGLDSVFRIVHGIGRRDISSQYDIERRYRGYMTDDQIHYICRIFENNVGASYKDIKQFIFDSLNIKVNRNIDSIIRNLYRKDPYCYYNITSKYNY